MSGPEQSSSAVFGLVDLPTLIQTISSQRRSGTLMLKQGAEQRRVYFGSGQVRAFGGCAPAVFGKALVWAEILTLEQLSECLKELPPGFREVQLIEVAEKKGWVTRDGLLDTMDCYIEEGFAEMVSWQTPEINFVTKLTGDNWAKYQSKLGINVSAGSMLLEGLRRQDEIKSFSAMIPDRWDVLVREASVALPGDLSADEQFLLRGWNENRSVSDVHTNAGLPPFRAMRAFVHLRQLGILRVATAAEVSVHADFALSRSRAIEAYRLYRRAIALGVDSPRVYLHVAELAEQVGEDQQVAAKAYLTAGQHIRDSANAVVALRNALRLGSDRLTPLKQLVGIYRQVGERDDAISALLEVAKIHEQAKDLDQAAQAVREAQELGADAATCAGVLARLAMAEGDMEQAVLQFELAARAAQQKGSFIDAADAYRQLTEILPSRCEYATGYADLLSQQGKTDEAADVLRKVLQQQHGESEEVLLQVYELLAKVKPDDYPAHEFLVKAYARRKNREGATEQLKVLAQVQEKEGDFEALAHTLERILEHGGDQVDILKRLALVYSRLGQEGKANATLCRSVDAALALGHLPEARQICEVAVDLDSSYLPLRSRLAAVANREGDRAAALIHYRAAAQLARGMNNLETARAMLLQLRKLRPDDLMVRIELGELAVELNDPAVDQLLQDLVHFAVRTNNFGVALEKAHTRVQMATAPAIQPRMELVELLRRMGDNANELIEGRQLLHDLLEQGEFDKGVELLQRMVASNSRNADLVLQLAELYAAVDDTRSAKRFFCHASSLLQIEGRIDEARAVIDQIEKFDDDHDALRLAREMLANGQALEWEAIRWSLSHDQHLRIADEISATSRKAVGANGDQEREASGATEITDQGTAEFNRDGTVGRA
jgi:tetratricopeptide (TPR) repeat protein